MLGAIVFLGAISATVALVPFKVTDCNHSSNKIVRLENAHLSTNPILIPGNATGSVDVIVLQPIFGNHYTLQLTIAKRVFGWFVLPCYNNISSNICTFELCDILSGKHYHTAHHCPPEITQTSPDFNCACPFRKGTHTVNPTTGVIKHLSSVLKFLAQGDYKAHITITDTIAKEEVACFEIQLSTKGDHCSGLECIFGK